LTSGCSEPHELSLVAIISPRLPSCDALLLRGREGRRGGEERGGVREGEERGKGRRGEREGMHSPTSSILL